MEQKEVHITNSHCRSADPLLDDDKKIALLVPHVALHWFLQYNCTSNSDLASVSNVNRRWRKITFTFLKDAFQAKVEEKSASSDIHMEGSQDEKSGNSSNNPGIYRLLLPDMAIEIARRRLAAMNYSSHLTSQESEAFCLAWFHPKGIQLRTIDLSDNCYHDDYSISSEFGEDNVHELVHGNTDLNASLQHLRQATQNLKRANNGGIDTKTYAKTNNNLQTVTDEWQGYRSATDVLIPFGYSTAFVQTFLKYAAEYNFDTKGCTFGPNGTEVEDQKVFDGGGHGKNDDFNLSKQRRTTFAVRGATFARPHGYCLCWHTGEKRILGKQAQLRLDTCKNIGGGRQAMWTDTCTKRKLIRMRDSLPRIVKSTRAKNPDFQLPFGRLEGQTQRCVQFLNAEKDRAVYMRTHAFDCGPVPAPITVFLVGIATEDGCFVSGLRNKFELGHMYPHDDSDSLVEMSPICIAVETASGKKNHLRNTSKTGSFLGSNHSSILINEDSDDSSDMFHMQTEEMIGDMNCRCKIQWRQKYDYDSSDDEDDDGDHDAHCKTDQSDEKESRMIHGSMGPGRWHVYTAVFDGMNSTIRVDGVEEPIEHGTLNSVQDDTPVLDGITIGSDHLFHMSLCFGEGSEGEGAGSIAELAYFKGVMDEQDITHFENFLMAKHGILHGSIGPNQDDSFPISIPMGKTKILDELPPKCKRGSQWQENKWMKDVHSLMLHSPPFEPLSGDRVPLRIAARHRSVAWHRCCEVTGTPIRVSRIGSKFSTGSSSDL
jgi:hypothetical protein